MRLLLHLLLYVPHPFFPTTTCLLWSMFPILSANKTGNCNQLCLEWWLFLSFYMFYIFQMVAAEILEFCCCSVLNVFLTVLKVCCEHIVLQEVEREWRTNLGILEDVAIESIRCESNREWFSLWSHKTSVTLCAEFRKCEFSLDPGKLGTIIK